MTKSQSQLNFTYVNTSTPSQFEGSNLVELITCVRCTYSHKIAFTLTEGIFFESFSSVVGTEIETIEFANNWLTFKISQDSNVFIVSRNVKSTLYHLLYMKTERFVYIRPDEPDPDFLFTIQEG